MDEDFKGLIKIDESLLADKSYDKYNDVLSRAAMSFYVMNLMPKVESEDIAHDFKLVYLAHFIINLNRNDYFLSLINLSLMMEGFNAEINDVIIEKLKIIFLAAFEKQGFDLSEFKEPIK